MATIPVSAWTSTPPRRRAPIRHWSSSTAEAGIPVRATSTAGPPRPWRPRGSWWPCRITGSCLRSSSRPSSRMRRPPRPRRPRSRAPMAASLRRLGVLGHSAGAHLALMIALDRRYMAAVGQPDLIKAAAGLAGPYDFLPFDVAASKNAFGRAPDPHPDPARDLRARRRPADLAGPRHGRYGGARRGTRSSWTNGCGPWAAARKPDSIPAWITPT